MHQSIGKTQSLTDCLDPDRARALHATLDRPGAAPVAGDALPPFWHHIYFWTAAPMSRLGRDGHPKTGDFIPDVGLPRRMWAGGSLEFLGDVPLGQQTTMTSRISDVVQKSGRSGPLAFVTLENTITVNGQPAMRERKDLVYREDRPAGSVVPPQARTDENRSISVTFSPTLLFRYSALTFNGHRIHYDRDYAQSVEGYGGLVVHGPLLAQLLVHLAEETLGPLAAFSFRATSALMDTEEAQLCVRSDGPGAEMWVRAADGRQCMTATAMGR